MTARVMSRVWALWAKDIRIASRDQLTSYMVLAPLLLGGLMALLLPLLEDAPRVFAVSSDLPAAERDILDRYGQVEVFADHRAVIARVGQRDHVPGIVPSPEPGPPQVLVEGDEPEPIRQLAGGILDYHANRDAGYPVTRSELVSLGRASTPIRLIATALLAYSVIVLIGLALGLSILDEKTSGTHLMAGCTPLRFAEYAAGKLSIGIVASAVMLVPAIAIPLGDLPALGALWLTALASAPFALAMGLLIGAIARSQLGAVAIMKVLLPLWTSMPVAGFVVPESWHWLLWPLGNHWGVQAFYQVIRGGQDAPYLLALWAMVAGIPILAAALWLLRQRLAFTPHET
ncbi:MAG: ABC transporter permease [Myxococcota bacterium]